MLTSEGQNSISTGIDSIAIVDKSIAQYTSLIQGLEVDKVVVLSSYASGIEQITQTLEQYQNVKSLHIFSHGSENILQLGNDYFSEASLNEHKDEIRSWGDALSPTADVLFFGCHLAADGDRFIQQISQLTQADVAASDDLTGHASLGGDWDLEVATGTIETAIAVNQATQASYRNQFNLVVNGSFEANAVDNDTWLTFDASNVQGWESWQGENLEIWDSGLQGVASTDGSNHLELDFGFRLDGIYQDIQTEANRTYQLSFDMRSRGTNVISDDEAVVVEWNGQKLKFDGYHGSAAQEWTEIELEVTGTGGLDRLLFRESTSSGASDGSGPFLDNIVVQELDSSPTPDPAPDPINNLEAIDGPFSLDVTARFDDLGAGVWQRVFDFGNGPAQDNIWLGQLAGTNDMAFEIWKDGVAYRVVAADAIIQGQVAQWSVGVDNTGLMWIDKDGVRVAEGQGAVPNDVERMNNFIGASNWGADTPLDGVVFDLAIANHDVSPDPDPTPEPEPITFGNSRYELGTAGLTWEAAEVEARAKGGKIVEIDSAAENAFIFTTFGGDTQPIWLGFNDKANEGTFVDSSGNPFAYSNWLPGEPNNYSGNQDYAVMSSSTGQWDDASNVGGGFFNGSWGGGYTNQLVIEFDQAGPTPEPPPVPGLTPNVSTFDPEGDGEWSDVIPLTIIPLHSIVLPDGKVFSYGSTEAGMQGGQFVYSLFDPETGVEKVLPNTTGTNIFCSNMTIDPATGNVLIFGGDGNGNGGGAISGIDAALVFDYRTETIRESEYGSMEYARWYPTSLTLPNGETLVLGGRDENYNGSTIPEVYNPDTGIRQLTGANMPDLGIVNSSNRLDESWWYPHAWVNTAGDVIIVEAQGDDIYRMTTDGQGSVEKIGTLGFEAYKLNTSMMYDIDRVAIVGDDGGIYVADISEAVPTFTQVATLENARTNAGMVPLPDGRMLIVGGSTPFGDGTDQGNGLTNAVYNPTIWDPDTNALTQLEDQAWARLYHSSALLLADGTIWSGGGGAPGPLTNTNVEIFAPTYFYDADGSLADRPEIADAPSNIEAGETFRITVAESSSVETVSAIKSGAMTHARNADGRFLELDFTIIDSTTIEISTPEANVMLPGLWMLFAVDTNGVPSEASMLGVDMAPVVDTPALQATTLQYFNIDDDPIDGAFELTVEARFDDVAGGNWQRVFDFGNGAAQDNVWLGQVAGTDDMRFEIWRNGVAYQITAPDAIAEGEIAAWEVSVDANGYMRLFKNGGLVAQGQGIVPANVERIQNYIGDSNWLTDSRLKGLVRNLEIVNDGDTPETGGQF